MSTTRATFGAILGTVSGVATSAVNIIEVGNTIVAKAQLAADDSLKQQTIRSKIANARMQEMAIREAAMEQAVSTVQIKKFQSQDNEHSEAYSEAYDQFASLFSTTSPKP